MTEETIILIIIGSVAAMLFIGGGIISATMVIRPKVLLRRRMAQIGVIDGPGQSERVESRRQKRIQEKVKQLASKGEKKGFVEAIGEEILQAGFHISIQVYLFCGLCAGVLMAFFYLMAMNPETLTSTIIGGGAAFLIGLLLLPRLFLRIVAARRQKHFTKHFADAIDLIVRGIKSGLPVNECFTVVAREFDPPLGEEFRLLVEGQNLGMTLDELLARGLQRLPTPEYRFFAIVTQIQKQTGGNLADTLSNLSTVLRDRKKLRDKVQALSSEAKSSAIIIGSLPFFVSGFLSVINPEYLMLLFTTSAGNWILYIDAFWLFCGIMVMRQMINFKV